ncbi:C-type mannose receptor 2-like [Pygocentrus nattereri]|uniref:C-type mannose receptor 2-like n=1 Tax=Pygocentrus nattereri TaxID=42514 RepID=UPI001891E72A|nr:C-type mannose receptor 2-like [Pygocentrus nattereri]
MFMDQKWTSFVLLLSVVYVASYLPHRYHFVNQYKTWTEGQSYCRQTFTDLATINNPEEMNMVKSMLQNKVGRVWIGLNRVDGQKWLWSLEDGSSFINGQSYNNWYTGEPNNGLNRNSCVFLWGSDGNWVDDDCTNVYNFVCYTDQLILINQNLTWREALRYCRDNYVDLVSVHSEEIQLWVKEVAQKASTELVWLGLRHTCTPGFWYWLNVSPMCYQNWAPGNGTGGEDCSTVERTGAVQARGGQQWVSLPETHKLNFICTAY